MMSGFYVGQTFNDPYPPEAAVWCNENGAFIEEIEAIDGVRRFEIKTFPAPTLEEAKTAKLATLEASFNAASEQAHCLSSVGFEIDADEIANRNIEGLVLVMAEGDKTLFRAYDNRFHEVTREQLEVMRREIVVNSQYLYQAKWTTEARIQAAQTVGEVEAMTITAESLAELANTLKTQGESDAETA